MSDTLNTRYDRPEIRADVWRLVELVGLVVKPGGDSPIPWLRDNGGRFADDLKEAGEHTDTYLLSKRIESAGEWAKNPLNASVLDVREFAAWAVKIALMDAKATRPALGDILSMSLLYSDNAGFRVDPGKLFDLWASEVRAVGLRVLAALSRPLSGEAEPWH